MIYQNSILFVLNGHKEDVQLNPVNFSKAGLGDNEEIVEKQKSLKKNLTTYIKFVTLSI